MDEDHPEYFDKVLCKPAINRYISIRKHLSEEWSKSLNKGLLKNTNGCLNKFSLSMYQINRLVNHQRAFLCNIQNFNSPSATAFATNLEEACFDFESLLLVTRSCLDRMTTYMLDLFGMQSGRKSFRILRNMVKRNCPKTFDQNFLISILDESKWLEDFMISNELNTSLRDTLSHSRSFSEGIQNCANILKVGSETMIAIDLESYSVPLFETTWKISKYLPFLFLNMLAYFNGQQISQLINDYIPRWKNWTLKISDFLEGKDDQPLKTDNITLATRMYPGGFEIRTDNILPSIYSRSISYCLELPRHVSAKEKQGWELIGRTPKGFAILIR